MDKSNLLSHLHPDLVAQIRAVSVEKTLPADMEILREGQYVKVIPIIIEGLVKVFTRYQGRELLLYYIKPNESCVMSFSASLKNEKSKVFAVTEEETTTLLIPVDKVADLVKEYPAINSLFFQLYNQRYTDLLDTINHVLFDKMDKRLYDYLKEKIAITGNNPLKIAHRQIANELGTAREVISRVMKKLEHEGKIIQNSNSIEII